MTVERLEMEVQKTDGLKGMSMTHDRSMADRLGVSRLGGFLKGVLGSEREPDAGYVPLQDIEAV